MLQSKIYKQNIFCLHFSSQVSLHEASFLEKMWTFVTNTFPIWQCNDKTCWKGRKKCLNHHNFPLHQTLWFGFWLPNGRDSTDCFPCCFPVLRDFLSGFPQHDLETLHLSSQTLDKCVKAEHTRIRWFRWQLMAWTSPWMTSMIRIIKYLSFFVGCSLIAQLVKNLPAMQETLVLFLDQEDPLEKG